MCFQQNLVIEPLDHLEICLLLLQAAGVRALAMVARGHVPYFGDFVKVEWVYSGNMICV